MRHSHAPDVSLDESGQLSQRRFFALGGIALRDTDWRELRGIWQTALEAHRWPTDKEVKWHGIRTGEVPPALADAIVAALAQAPVQCYVTLLDIELGTTAAPEFFANDEDVYATGLMFLAERFQLLLEAANDVGMIIVDSRRREDDSRLRRFFADLTNDGSPYSRLDRTSKGYFSVRAITRSDCSAPTWSARSRLLPSVGTARHGATFGNCCRGSRRILRPAPSRGLA